MNGKATSENSSSVERENAERERLFGRTNNRRQVIKMNLKETKRNGAKREIIGRVRIAKIARLFKQCNEDLPYIKKRKFLD